MFFPCSLSSTVVANDANFDGFIETINDNLRPLFLEIRKGRSEDDGKNYFAFVSIYRYIYIGSLSLSGLFHSF